MPIVPADGATLIAQSVSNAQIPTEGPKVISILLDFTVALSYDLNTLLTQASAQMRSVSGVYVDNLVSSDDFQIDVSIVNQRVTVGGNNQGYFTLFVPKNATITMSDPTNQSPATVRCIFTNFPVANFTVR